MDFIVSLAHFCEIHGPTTILCTQLSPIACAHCFPVTTTPPSEIIPKNASFSSSFWDAPSPVVTPNTGPLFSPFTSPPTSPKSPNVNSNFNPYFSAMLSEATPGRKFSFGSESEGDSCDNCNLILPKRIPEHSPENSPDSPTKDGKRQGVSPVLRTIKPVVAYGTESGLENDDENVSPIGSDTPSSTLGTSPTPSQESTPGLETPPYHQANKHIHNMTYVTRRQPESQSVYSRLRHSCIRTLSCEQLPRGSSSGPILFGDPIAGYTIAYMFRLPDPRARGRRRTYALTALGRDCWRVMAAFVPVTKAFESIASRIIAMTDRVLEKESALVSRTSASDLLRTPPLSASLPPDSHSCLHTSPPTERAKSSTNSPIQSQRNLAEPSSFLSAKKVDPDGYPRVSREVMRAKGLPELVGKESFFVELHAHFCVILSTLVNSLPR